MVLLFFSNYTIPKGSRLFYTFTSRDTGGVPPCVLLLRLELRGALCYILDPHKFKIIKDSWNKTDKHDARNMAKALWVYLVTGEFGIPAVYKPQVVVWELRRFFT